MKYIPEMQNKRNRYNNNKKKETSLHAIVSHVVIGVTVKKLG